MLVLVIANRNFALMSLSPDLQQHSVKSIDQGLIQTVIQTYTSCKAEGHGEMAARNAAIGALRDALPSWQLRAASDMVSRIIASHAPLTQSA